jgi:antitoxin ParD1/3/4
LKLPNVSVGDALTFSDDFRQLRYSSEARRITLMATMNISLPDPLREFVERCVAEGGYHTVSEYFRELVRADQRRRAAGRIEGLMLEGVNSGPATPLTRQDIEAVKLCGLERIRRRKAG